MLNSFRIATFVIALIIPISSLAVDVESVEGIPGNSIIPLQESVVILIKWVVNIDGRETEIKVNSEFTLKNTSDKSINLSMGYPFDDVTNIYGKSIDGLDGFKIVVNDQELSSVKKKTTDNEDISLRVYDNLYTWNVEFKPKEVKIIELRYIMRWSLPDFRTEDRELLYITKAASSWKGNIQQADFYIHLSNRVSKDLKDNYLHISSSHEDYKIKDYKVIEYHFKNWEPTENISIGFFETD